MAKGIDLDLIWREVKRVTLDKKFTRMLLDAFEAAKPIALEGDILIIGMEPHQFQLRGHLQLPEIKVLVRGALAERLGRPVDFRIIDGTTLEYWESIKGREAEIETRQGIGVEHKVDELSRQRRWNDLLELVYISYSKLTMKVLPQVRAGFVLKTFGAIRQLEKELPADDEAAQEVNQKWVGKILDRLGNLVDVNSTVLALEFEHYRGDDD